MQERVKRSDDRFSTNGLVVQWQPDLMEVVVGVERIQQPKTWVERAYENHGELQRLGKELSLALHYDPKYHDFSTLDFPSSDVERDFQIKLGMAMTVVMNKVQRDMGIDDAQYAGLDRPGVNRLIRLLRKARDAAFGADA